MTMVASSLRLALLGTVVAALLAGVDAVTRGQILANEQRGLVRVFVDVTGDGRLAKLTGPLTPPLTVCTAAGTPLYAVYGHTARGYAGVIQLLLAVDAAGKVAGVRAISHRETAGIGDVIDGGKSDWIRSFDGLTAASLSAGAVDVVSGASVTTRAVIDGVRDALIDAASAPSQGCSNVLDD